MPADPLPYRDSAHKGPASEACQPYSHFKSLSDFDHRNQVCNLNWSVSNCQPRSFGKIVKRRQRKNLVDTRAGIERERIAMSCITSFHIPREFNPERAYLDEKSWYTTCAAPVKVHLPLPQRSSSLLMVLLQIS